MIQNNTPEKQLPDYRLVAGDDVSMDVELFVPGTLPFFEDHFPDRPVVPGVVQVQWVFEIAGRLIPAHDQFAVRSLKFNRPMVPDRTYSLEVRSSDGGRQLSFRYFDDRTHYSVGKLEFTS